MSVNLTMSLVGWFHTAACVAALILGGALIVARKGTPRHRRWGDAYVAAIVFASLSSLTIYSRHTFTFAHGFAIMALVTSLGGFALGRWHGKGGLWTYGHLTLMLLSYYVLIGGGVNEVFLRVAALKPFITPAFTPVVGLTHLAVMVTFLALIVAFSLATAVSQIRLVLRRRKARAGAVARVAA